MAEKTTKKITDIEKADAFYDAVMKYKEKIEKTEKGLESFEKSGRYKEYDEGEAKAMEALQGLGERNLTDSQKEIITSGDAIVNEHNAREKLIAQKEEYSKNIQSLESQIKIVISKYIADAEKEKKKLETNKTKYAAFVEEEKAKYNELKAEVESMEKDSNEEEKDILEAKKEQLEALKSQLDGFDKKLSSYEERITKLDNELTKNKEKYKDYIDLSKEDIVLPEVPETQEQKASEAKEKVEVEEEAKEEDTTKAEEEENKDNQTKYVEVPEQKQKSKSKNDQEAVFVAATMDDTQNEKSKDEETLNSESNKRRETDKQAYKRITKALLKKNGEISDKDTSRLLDILGNKENFDKLGIRTVGFFSFLKSRAEKVYIKLGAQLDRKLRENIKDENLVKGLNTKDLKDIMNISELGVGNATNNILETLDSAMKNASEKEQEKLKGIKGEYEKFTKSAGTFVEVKAQRGEYNIWELPAPKEETKETIEVSNKNDLSGLSEMVKSDREIAETIEVEDNVKDAKAIEKSEENHEVR